MPSPDGRVTKSDCEEVAKSLGLRIINEDIKPGDMYLAGRNTGVKLLECESVDDRNWINSTDPIGYPYDTWECYKVIEISN